MESFQCTIVKPFTTNLNLDIFGGILINNLKYSINKLLWPIIFITMYTAINCISVDRETKIFS